MPWQYSFKKICFFAPIMPKIMLAQSAKAYLGNPVEYDVQLACGSPPRSKWTCGEDFHPAVVPQPHFSWLPF